MDVSTPQGVNWGRNVLVPDPVDSPIRKMMREQSVLRKILCVDPLPGPPMRIKSPGFVFKKGKSSADLPNREFLEKLGAPSVLGGLLQGGEVSAVTESAGTSNSSRVEPGSVRSDPGGRCGIFDLVDSFEFAPLWPEPRIIAEYIERKLVAEIQEEEDRRFLASMDEILGRGT